MDIRRSTATVIAASIIQILASTFALSEQSLPISQSRMIVCTDERADYIDALRRINKNMFNNWYSIDARSGEASNGDGGSLRIYIGRPFESNNRPACLSEDTQLSEFVEYVQKYAVREVRVPVGGTGEYVTATVAYHEFASPEGTVAGDDSVAAVLCFTEINCVEDVAMSIFGLSRKDCADNVCFRR